MINIQTDEIFDQIESLIYILAERMSEEALKDKLKEVVDAALADVEAERKLE